MALKRQYITGGFRKVLYYGLLIPIAKSQLISMNFYRMKKYISWNNTRAWRTPFLTALEREKVTCHYSICKIY